MSTVKPQATLIELDSRKRAPLRQLAQHQRYLVTVDEDGVLIFTPAVVMTEFEAAFRNAAPELYANVVDSTKHPDHLTRRPLPASAYEHLADGEGPAIRPPG